MIDPCSTISPRRSRPRERPGRGTSGAAIRALCLAASLAFALAACARSESSGDAAAAVKATAEEDVRAREQAATTRAEGMRQAGKRGREAATRELERSDASEARRKAAN